MALHCDPQVEWRVLQLISLYEIFGNADVVGQAVSQQSHALQAGTFAVKQQQKEHVIVAALFHDVGHTLGLLTQASTAQEVAKDHASIGATYLKRLGFPDKVTLPVAHHVHTQRYLKSTQPAEYGLSDVQGGPMSAQEVVEFERKGSDFIQDSVCLRLCSDHAKDPDAVPLDWNFFRPIIRRVLASATAITP